MKKKKSTFNKNTLNNDFFFDQIDYERSCSSKIKYENEWQVKFAADECYQKNKIKLYWYHCKYCNGWHLTSSY